jgi:hypothetical protein
VVQLFEARGDDQGSPPLPAPVRTVSLAVPALFVHPTRVRSEEHAPRLESRSQLAEHPRQVAARDMKERRVGKHTVETRRWEREREEVLL